MKNEYGNLLSIMLIIAIIVVVSILGFLGYKVYTSGQTDKGSKDVASKFDESVNNNNDNNNNSSDGDSSNDDNNTSNDNNENNESLGDILSSLGENDGSQGTTQQQGNKDVLYQGYKVIGTISIPSINIEYPILEENTSATLKIAIVAVYPQDNRKESVNKPGNLVLWGHNYKNGTFFSDINKLTTGSKIYIKDTSGTKLEYQVYNTYTTSDSDMTYATRDTEGAREITLSTCDNEAGKRTIVWARET